MSLALGMAVRWEAWEISKLCDDVDLVVLWAWEFSRRVDRLRAFALEVPKQELRPCGGCGRETTGAVCSQRCEAFVQQVERRVSGG